MPDPLGPGGWAYWRERFTRADAERTHLRAEVEQQRKQWEDIWRRNVDLLAEIERLRERVRQLTFFLDQQMGTPCEQIRHEQEVERLRAALYRARWEGEP